MSEGYRLPGVEIFAAGSYRGRDYSVANLDEIVRNFDRLSRSKGGKPVYLRVPSVIGHDEDQEWLKASNLPAAGWIEGVRRKGGKLLADVGGVPGSVARLLKGGAYRGVSAELYDRAPDGAGGLTLRRLAFLGGDQPQVKGLADIPTPEAYSESFASARRVRIGLHPRKSVRLPGGTYAVFSEAKVMTETEERPETETRPDAAPREDMIGRLADHGMDVSAVDERVPDHTLAEMVRVCDAKDEAREPHPLDMDEWPEPKDDSEKASYRERCKKYAERLKKFSDRYGAEQAEREDVDEPERPMKMSEQSVEAIVARAIAEAEKRLEKKAGSAVDTLQKHSEQVVRNAKKQGVDALIEQLSLAGKLPPVEREAERELLLALDDSTVHKFSEGGKTVSRSLFDHRVETLKRRPTMFGERFKQPLERAGSDDAEKRQLEEHFELFAESFGKSGITAEKLVKGYQAAKARDRNLTVERYLNQ